MTRNQSAASRATSVPPHDHEFGGSTSCEGRAKRSVGPARRTRGRDRVDEPTNRPAVRCQVVSDWACFILDVRVNYALADCALLGSDPKSSPRIFVAGGNPLRLIGLSRPIRV